MQKPKSPFVSRMKAREWTFTELGALTGLHEETLKRVSTGSQTMSFKLSEALDKAFGLDVGTIYQEHRDWMHRKIGAEVSK